MNAVATFFFQFDIPSLILGALFGAVLAIGLDLYIKRPKLIINGGGGGNRGNGTQGNNISIHNEIGWFGINIPETRILGIRIHPSIRFGLPFQKTDAQDCRAHLFLADTNEFISLLWWSNADGSVEEVKSIRSGDSASLLLFIAKTVDRKYFPYQPADRKTGEVKFPEEPAYFAGTKKFYIQINYSYNQILRYELNISEKYDGKLYLETKNGSSFFLG